MIINNKIVYFFCDNYTVPFVKTEVSNLSAAFKHVVIITSKDHGRIDLANVEIKALSFSDYSSVRVLSSNFFTFARLMLNEVFSSITYFKHPAAIKNISSDLLRTFYLKGLVQDIIKSSKSESVFYSFWFNKWATLLAILSRENVISGYISRTHGTDLFEERVPLLKKIPFRKLQLQYASKIFSVSMTGESYLKQKYPDFQEKIFTGYLGTKYAGNNVLKDNGVFTMVSCARLRNIKRIHLLAEMIEKIDFPVKWIHIGSENSRSTDVTIKQYQKHKERIKLKSNIEFIPTGDLSNEEVFEIYRSTPVNLFVSVSETEGLPVSMMEAISFGIPVFSTNVGGCKEIVTPETGFLIEKDFEQSEFLKALNEFRSSERNSEKYREGVRNFWRKHFDNQVNFSVFLESNRLN